MTNINERIKKIINSLDKTKTEIAKTLNVTPAYLSKLVKTGNPSDMFISNFCYTYNVNENWLRTGEGDMFISQAEKEKITAFLADVFNDEEKPYKKQLILALADLSDDGWKGIEELIAAIIKAKDKEEFNTPLSDCRQRPTF